MCGFVALWECGTEDLAEAMLNRIVHRGPDGNRVRRVEGAPAILAHARLAIIGPNKGEQPIHRGRDALVVNGEIYNHEELRKLLGAEKFHTDSDSEAVLHLLATEEGRWVERLDGMFAFVAIAHGRLIAGRDPLGIKPLYVADLDGGLAFASEVKAFDGVGVSNVRPLPPGSLFDTGLNDGQGGLRRWFRMPQGAAAALPDDQPEGVARELRYVLEAAIAKWSVADVEVGSFLSGGLDSSLVAAIAHRQRLERGLGPLKTFAVGVAGSNDLKAAREVAEHLGTEHFDWRFTAEDLADALPGVVRHLESADVDLVRSALPTRFAADLARRHVKAVLTGEGADELFAGYTYHKGYLEAHRALADELTRSLGTMHNINLQRVDRLTMAVGLEARTPFLDRDLIAFAQAIPAELKLRADEHGRPVEKWILRLAVEDLLPHDLVWRRKAQFDEGSGVVAALQDALKLVAERQGRALPPGHEIDRATEAKIYRRAVEDGFANPNLVFTTAGDWTANRVAA